MIEVKNLVKKYGNHTAVKDLSFNVEKGQIYGFLGPNGAGKSTTMNIMTGYIAATSGEVIINGHNILEEPEEAKKCIGYLPEFPPLYLEMTVTEYLRFAAELKNIKKEDRENMIEEAIELTKLQEVRKRLIRNISKGYKQRVGLAQAVLGFPEIIILDEPTVGLDPKQIIEIRDLIKRLSKKHTVILSSHILSEVSAVCDHILIIAHGELVASDTPENLSKLMVGENSLELTVRGDKKRVERALKEVGHILKSELHSSVQEKAWDIKLKVDENYDIREELFYALARKDCPILMLKSSHMSLEDVFLELTRDHAPKVKKKSTLFSLKKKESEDADDDSALEDDDTEYAAPELDKEGEDE